MPQYGFLLQFDADRVFYPGKIPVERGNFRYCVLPAGGNNKCIIGKKRMRACNFFNTTQVRRIRNDCNAGKDFIEVPDKFIRKFIPLPAYVFLEMCGVGNAEFIFRNKTEPDKECLFIYRHARSTGIRSRRVKGTGRSCSIRLNDNRDEIVLYATFQTNHKRKCLALVLREKMRNALLEKTDRVRQVFDLNEVSKKSSMHHHGECGYALKQVSSLT